MCGEGSTGDGKAGQGRVETHSVWLVKGVRKTMNPAHTHPLPARPLTFCSSSTPDLDLLSVWVWAAADCPRAALKPKWPGGVRLGASRQWVGKWSGEEEEMGQGVGVWLPAFSSTASCCSGSGRG